MRGIYDSSNVILRLALTKEDIKKLLNGEEISGDIYLTNETSPVYDQGILKFTPLKNHHEISKKARIVEGRNFIIKNDFLIFSPGSDGNHLPFLLVLEQSWIEGIFLNDETEFHHEELTVSASLKIIFCLDEDRTEELFNVTEKEFSRLFKDISS